VPEAVVELSEPAAESEGKRGRLDPVASAEDRAREAGEASREVLEQLRKATAKGDGNAARAFGAAYAASADRAYRAETQVLELRAQHDLVDRHVGEMVVAAVQAAIAGISRRYNWLPRMGPEAERAVGQELRRLSSAEHAAAGELVEGYGELRDSGMSDSNARAVLARVHGDGSSDVNSDPGVSGHE
jgi:hypothetical protein